VPSEDSFSDKNPASSSKDQKEHDPSRHEREAHATEQEDSHSKKEQLPVQKLPADSPAPNESIKRCWNCNKPVNDSNWCTHCKVPLDPAIKQQIITTESFDGGKCWRCSGTTSGDICGICGSPLTIRGLQQYLLPTATSKDEELEHIYILSPKDRLITRVPVNFAEIEGLVEEHFELCSSTLTPYGPEMVITKPSLSDYSTFAKSKLLTSNNIRPLFKALDRQKENQEERIILRFFYWEPVDHSKRFSFENIRWKGLLLVLSVVSLVITGWLYIRKIYQFFNINQSMFFHIFMFSIVLLMILAIHELTHYLIQRRKKKYLSLPYFLPIPPIPGFMSFLMLGTAGGFVRVMDPIERRDDLFDLYFYSPLVGLVLSLAIYFIGLRYPFIASRSILTEEVLTEIESINQLSPVTFLVSLVDWLADTLNFSPNVNPTTHVMFYHPIAYAGYLGIIINGLNYLPGTILDGGFLFRSMFGELPTRVASFVSSVILLLNYNTWALGVLTLFVPLNAFQTTVSNEVVRPHWLKYCLGIFSLIIALSCVPFPLFFFTSF
jgi:hypothetical protein